MKHKMFSLFSKSAWAKALFLVIIGVVAGIGQSAWARCVVVDSQGNRVLVESPFKRIISLYGAHTENLFSLGLDEEIIAVGRSETYPPRARTKPRFSYRDDPERFIAARADLVLIRPMIARGYPHLVAKLRNAGIEVVSLQPRGPEEMFQYWRALGCLTGRQQEAEQMIERFKKALAEIRQKISTIPLARRKRVYFESIHSRMKTFSPHSIAVFVLTQAGGINVASDAKSIRKTNIAEYGKERILARGHEIDVYLAQYGPMNRITKAQILNESGFQAIKAIREGRVYLIDEQIVSRPTMRLLQGIRRIASILYPGLFL